MPLLSVQQLTFGYGGPPLLDAVELHIDPGERICLLGRNGEGKSTFLKILSGEISVGDDAVAWQRGVKVAVLDQTVPEELPGNVYDVVSEGLGERGALLKRHHDLTEALNDGVDDAALRRLEKVQEEIDAAGAWNLQQEVDRAISTLGLPADAEVAPLSAGMKRRVLLARALVSEPDILLLDEPTNHLDVDGIAWLEEFLERFSGALLFVTHDRAFMERLASRILELDRGRLTSWSCDYRTFLERRAEALAAEEKEWARQDKKLAQEEAWVRKGIKARRTRNEGRVRALERMRDERRQRREMVGTMRATLDEGERSGQLVIDARDLHFGFDEKPLVDGFSTRISRGDKIGLIGPNGVGKSTLLKLLLGELEPQRGTVRHGTKLEVAYFDQLHQQLDPTKSLAQNVNEAEEFVEIGGRRKHITAYLEDFLFSKDRIRGQLSSLSGGERNRLLLAKLFVRPANLLVLDEPTNDLDIESLELLESLLVEYSGTILIVSHDRRFLDNVATFSYVFDGDGKIREVVGGYDVWQREREERQQAEAAAKASRSKPATKPQESSDSRGLTYNEQKELAALPAQIEELEGEVTSWHERMAAPGFYDRPPTEVAADSASLEAVQASLETAYARWEELESRTA